MRPARWVPASSIISSRAILYLPTASSSIPLIWAAVTDIMVENKERRDKGFPVLHRDAVLHRLVALDAVVDVREPHLRGHRARVDSQLLPVEMGGQLGLCLTHFLGREDALIPDDSVPVPVRAAKLLGAYFVAPLLPGKEAWIIAKKLKYDAYFGTVLSQVLCEGQVCCVSIAEVIFLDDRG